MKGGRGVYVERKVEKQGKGEGNQAEREMRGEGKETGRERREGRERKEREERKRGRKREGMGKGGRGERREIGERGEERQREGTGRKREGKEAAFRAQHGPIVLTYSGILSRKIWKNKTDPVEKCASEESMPELHLEGVGGTRLPVCTASL